MMQILGQPHAVSTLTTAIRAGRMHHAWVFAGPRGVGKLTTAVALSRWLLDPDVESITTPIDESIVFDSTRTSEVCRLINAESHPDLHIIRKELALYSDNAQLRSRKLLNIPLDLLRERMLGGRTADDRRHEAAAYRTATLGHGKVFIIDEAELLDKFAQNSLLKTLEEPPLGTYIFLVTSKPERLLPTIRSRCQYVRFNGLDDASMEQWFAASELVCEPAERQWIETFCDGSPGVALLASEYGLYGWRTILSPMIDRLNAGRFPLEMGAAMAQCIDEYAQAWVKANENASKDAANKDGARHMFTLLASHLRTELREQIDRGAEISHLLAAIEIITETERQLDTNVNTKLALENLVVQWARCADEAMSAAV